MYAFRKIKSGEMSQEDYLSWVQDQAGKVLAEEERRRLNPTFEVLEEGREVAPSGVSVTRGHVFDTHFDISVKRVERRMGTFSVDSALFVFDNEDGLLSVVSEANHRPFPQPIQDVRTGYSEQLALSFQEDGVNFRHIIHQTDAGNLGNSASGDTPKPVNL